METELAEGWGGGGGAGARPAAAASWAPQAADSLTPGARASSSRAGRCAVCVVQRKGKCGTESAPRKCLRRQMLLQGLQADVLDSDPLTAGTPLALPNSEEEPDSPPSPLAALAAATPTPGPAPGPPHPRLAAPLMAPGIATHAPLGEVSEQGGAGPYL
ncbi:hypothetical protein V8C86DRAFT_2764480, partial [Haematococcus lacustris]